MAHILSAKIHGLAGRKTALDIKFNRDINMFFGLNGSGKSSLLKILNAAMDGEIHTLTNVPFTSAEIVLYSMDYKQEFTLVYDKAKIEKEINDQVLVGEPKKRKIIRSKWETTPPIPNKVTKWQHVYLPTSRIYHNPKVISAEMEFGPDSPTDEDSLDMLFGEAIKQLWHRYFLEIASLVQKAQENGLAAFVKAAITPDDKKSKTITEPQQYSYEAVTSFLKRQGSGVDKLLKDKAHFEKRIRTNAVFRRIAADLTEVESKIDEAKQPINALEQLLNKMFGNKKISINESTLKVVDSKEEPIPIPYLSSGEKHLLKIFIENLLAAKSTIIIDEPELSLHITWQRMLISSLKTLNPDTQIIAATHSPEVLAELPDHQIFKI